MGNSIANAKDNLTTWIAFNPSIYIVCRIIKG